jgi:O-antigen ligase
MTTSVQKKYPVRYWLTFAYLTGLPNFVHFDPTGRTHDYGLFNLTSLSDIGLTLFVVTGFLIVSILSRQKPFLRKIEFGGGVWIALMLSFGVASLLQPDYRLTTPGSEPKDILIALFRLGQWGLALILLPSLCSRASEEEVPTLITQLIARMCWVDIAIVWIMLPIAPSLAYVSEDGTTDSVARLGGILLHPALVALLSSVAFLHSLLLLSGFRRTIGCVISLVTLMLTYTRSAQIIFLFALWIYLVFFPPKRIWRWVGIFSLLATIAAGVVLHSAVQSYISRGQREADVNSFSGRTEIWQVAAEAGMQRAFLGYGYISGPRNILRDNWRETHWLPPHAHNEFFQAFLSGGFLSVILVAWIYLYVLWVGCRRARFQAQTKFFLLIWIQLTVTTITSTNITTGFGRVGALLLACLIALYPEGKRLHHLNIRMPLLSLKSSRWRLNPTRIPLESPSNYGSYDT